MNLGHPTDNVQIESSKKCMETEHEHVKLFSVLILTKTACRLT